jgi:hypothetical protein
MRDPIELHALADGEIDGDARRQLEAEIASCSDSALELDAIRNVKRCLARLEAPAEASAVWEDCRDRLAEIDRSRRIDSFVGRYAWAVCAVFFLCIFAGGMVHRSADGPAGTADVARALAGMSSLSASATSPGAAEQHRWVDGLLDFARQSASPERLEVLGVAEGFLNGRDPMACFSLRDARGDLALIVTRKPIEFDGEPSLRLREGYSGQMQGLNFVAWRTEGHTLILLGERSLPDLEAVSLRIAR